MGILRLCGTEIFVRLCTTKAKTFFDFAQLKINMLPFCATKVICATLVCSFGSRFVIYVWIDSTKKWYVCTFSTQAEAVSTLTRPKLSMFRLSSTKEERFDRVRIRSFFTHKNFDRNKTFGLFWTKKEHFS